jgi:2-succinyl-5-enolpyruvyl-6-hydroxy-3-cyclohexene-1-carboxylate synthase
VCALAADEAGAVLHAYVGAFVDGLVASGVRRVCVAPGSRSTPLALEVWRHPEITVTVHLDERSCGYFALGMAKASGEPVGLICTSGTAAANFMPAVVEASLSNVPLVVLTADRPPELRAVRAPQTIDQTRLYGPHVKRFVEMSTPSGSTSMVRYAGHWGARVVSEAMAAPRGPVHCNFPFREPLIPIDEAGAAEREAISNGTVMRGSVVRPSTDEVAADVAWMREAERGLIVCGPELPTVFAGWVAALAGALGWPVLADPLSQVRCGTHDRSLVVDSYDAFLRDASVAASLRPEAVLRFGGPPTSKTLGEFLEGSGARQVIVVEGDGWSDPSLVAERAVRSDPSAFCETMLKGLEALADAPVVRTDDGWVECWRGAGEAARAAIVDHFASDETLSEPRVMAEVAAAVGNGATVFAGNSMPVRDLDGFFRGSDRRVRFLANRGASGIDGVVSSALGVAAVSAGAVVLVVGDVSFYHDMNGLLAASGSKDDVTIVVVNNDGGGIFSFLPQAERVAEFEPLFGTPHGLTFEAAASLYGLGYGRAESVEALRRALAKAIGVAGTQIIEVPTERAANVRQHEALWAAVAERVSSSS